MRPSLVVLILTAVAGVTALLPLIPSSSRILAGQDTADPDPVALPEPSAHHRHAVFETSRTPGGYFESRVVRSGSSGMTHHRGRVPVDTTLFHSAPNALRLQWWSAPGGYWEAELRPDLWRNRGEAFEGDALSFWIHAPAPLPGGRLPRLRVSDAAGRASRPFDLTASVGELPAGEWVRVVVPLDRLEASEPGFEPRRLAAVSFLQPPDAEGAGLLLVDDIRIDDEGDPGARPPAAPGNLRARGFERHVELVWDARDPAADRYEIQRSDDDGATWRPVGVQQAGIPRFAAWVGEPGRPLRFRLVALDRTGRPSPPSEAVSAATRPMTDDELLDMVQEAHFRYYWEGAHPVSGLARENIPGDDDLVAIGASGFGIMAIVVAAERGFISRDAAAARMLRIVRFLERADRFHGAWPHFLDGRTGEVIPLFGRYDNGADLVETAFLTQGLLAARQYFDADDPVERDVAATITRLWEAVEWDWFRRTPVGEFLWWHWSPDHAWQIDHPLIGFNETAIVYVLAIASPTHPVPADLYYSGWAGQSERAVRYRRGWGGTIDGDRYTNGNTYHGFTLPVGVGVGGPLFFTHYSYMGLDPRALTDRWTNYFDNNRAIARINRAYAAANPGGYRGHGDDAWGLTASDDPWGYAAHEPRLDRDNGTLAPTGALASFPYTPDGSMAALRHFYRELGHLIWGEFGFRDAVNLTEEWVAPIFMGLNQAPVTVMIENHRSGLLWRLFMENGEVRSAVEAIR